MHFIQLNTETHREGTVAFPIHVVYEHPLHIVALPIHVVYEHPLHMAALPIHVVYGPLQASSTHVLFRVPYRTGNFQGRNH